MKKVKNSELLLSYIREGRTMTSREKLALITQLSIPSILAQISATVMFFIDASMVGHLGAKASAAIGLVETTGWLMGGLASAANMGFSVQVAHCIGANDFEAARRVLRQSIVCCLIWSLITSVIALGIAPFLPYWLGGSAEIARDASLYFGIFGICGIFFQMEGLAGSMLKCSGNMKIPSVLNIGMCVMDVVFNYLFIYVLDLKVVGAAIGTGVAILITACLMLYFLIFRSKMLSLVGRPGSFKPQSDTVSTAFKIGAPMGLQHLLMGGESLLHAWLWHCRGSYHACRAGDRRRPETAYPLVCLYVCRSGHYGDDTDGCADVDLRSRADGYHVACRRGDRARYGGASHRGLGRANVCSVYRGQWCLHRSWRHADSCHHESCLDVGCSSDFGCLARSQVWLEGCVDCDGYRVGLQRYDVPGSSLQRWLGREDEGEECGVRSVE